MCAVSSDDVQVVHSHFLDGIYHQGRVEATTGGTQHGATQVVDIFDHLRVKFNPVFRELFVEPAVAPLDAPYLSDIIVIPKRHHNAANDDIQAGTEPATCDDAGNHFVTLEVDCFSDTSSGEFQGGLQLEGVFVEFLLEHKVSIFNEGHLRESHLILVA